ncbi:alpha/beta hydrolase [Streptomyces resistomycificus]|uniref:alpha/beta hydrolase n=1 Tax=Streptomyces resistomycificus TaxID=67356 RepID=UPI0004AAED67|nr:alpha/beta hydrolase [Streptomyces resistomycificus]
MTSFDTSPQLNVWRALLALAVVFVMLATTGWTALRSQRSAPALEASLSDWEHGRIAGHRLPDPQDTAPHHLARFFTSLTAQQRASLARRYPLAVGNMNGAPVELRYRANRIALGQARKVELKRMRDTGLTPDCLYGSGRVAEVFGSLRKAERVSVVVPGVDTDLLTFQRTNRRYSAPVGMAKALYRAERAASPSTRTAVIAWADYTAPSGLGIDSATAMRAADGAIRLNALVKALPGSTPVSLFCHSYGSVVCGLAARTLPDRVADIAVAGSPGMRVTNASQLHTSAQVWAMRDADDWIQDVPYLEVGGFGHGADPMSAAFGARVLSARGADGHSGYFEPGTESLLNFAEIGIGAYRSVQCAGDVEACRTGLSGTASAGRA